MKNIVETALRNDMKAQLPLFVSEAREQIREAINERRKWEEERNDGETLPDFVNVENLDTDEMARFSLAIGLNPFPYIASPLFDKKEFEELSGISWEARTRNQRAYRKMSGAASFFFHNDTRGLEETLKSFVACAILASSEHDILPRNLFKTFMQRAKVRHATPELLESLEKFRIKGLRNDNGAQVSHCSLQLAQMKAGEVVRNGKEKDFRLNLESPVTVAFAQRFGLEAELEAAKNFRKNLYH